MNQNRAPAEFSPKRPDRNAVTSRSTIEKTMTEELENGWFIHDHNGLYRPASNQEIEKSKMVDKFPWPAMPSSLAENNMTSLDMFDACSKIADACSTLPDEQVKRAILMALIAIGKQQLLIDPQEIMIKSTTIPKCPDDVE